MKPYIALIIASLAIASCAKQNYTYDGRKYTDANQMDADMRRDSDNNISMIQRLPKPLTSRYVVIIAPTFDYYIDTTYSIASAVNSNISKEATRKSQPNISNYRSYEDSFRAIEKSGIYTRAEYKTVDQLTDVQPSDDYDVITWKLPDKLGLRTQSYYISKRNGKQLLNTDQSVSGYQKLASYIDAVKSLAIQ